MKKPPIANGITRYHTIQFYTNFDLVRYWHRVWRHASEQQMRRIVGDATNPSVFTNLPAELTPDAIRKYFRQLNCLDCAIGGLHLRSAPGLKPFVPGNIGAHWQIDEKKFSGKDSHPIIGLNGCTHTFSGIDHASGRVFGYPTQESVKAITHVKWLWQTNHDNGYVMETISADPEFKTKAVAKFLKSCQPSVQLLISITDEHF